MLNEQLNRLLVAVVGIAVGGLIVLMGIGMWQDVGNENIGRADTELESGFNFDLPAFDGSRFVLTDHIQNPIFLYFWASWCAPCEIEAPLIQSLWPEYRERGYTFIGINIWDNTQSAQDFVDRHGLEFPIVIDDGNTYLDYGVYGIPEAFFLLPGLRVDQKYIGTLTEVLFRKHLENIKKS
tara:strand:+ start:6445 stop:6987 length:543 start_codon:yes stop_codon:yes gene_type:complete